MRRRLRNASVTVDILRLCKIGEIDRDTQPTTFVQCFAEMRRGDDRMKQSSSTC